MPTLLSAKPSGTNRIRVQLWSADPLVTDPSAYDGVTNPTRLTRPARCEIVFA